MCHRHGRMVVYTWSCSTRSIGYQTDMSSSLLTVYVIATRAAYFLLQASSANNAATPNEDFCQHLYQMKRDFKDIKDISIDIIYS